VRTQAVLLTTVYLGALAVALRDPSEHLLAGAVVLLALLWRLPATRAAISCVVASQAVRDRRSRRAVDEAVTPVVAPVTPG
jgi:hypothetical protein